MPAVLLFITVFFQAVLYWHGSTLVTAAAQQGAVDASGEAGSEAAGRRGAEVFLSRAGSGVLRSPEVSVSRGPERTRVSVSAGVVELMPGLAWRVSATAEASTEGFRPVTGR